jgi:hypothetical protein
MLLRAFLMLLRAFLMLLRAFLMLLRAFHYFSVVLLRLGVTLGTIRRSFSHTFTVFTEFLLILIRSLQRPLERKLALSISKLSTEHAPYILITSATSSPVSMVLSTLIIVTPLGRRQPAVILVRLRMLLSTSGVQKVPKRCSNTKMISTTFVFQSRLALLQMVSINTNWTGILPWHW